MNDLFWTFVLIVCGILIGALHGAQAALLGSITAISAWSIGITMGRGYERENQHLGED